MGKYEEILTALEGWCWMNKNIESARLRKNKKEIASV